MTNPGRRADSLSPNQAEKRRQIIAAAKLVLARDGLASCTARAVADASPLTKSAIHYYFSDMDVLVDAAMSAHIDTFVARLREASSTGEQPLARLHSAVGEYLAMFGENPRSLVLWNEYWIDAVRRDRTGPLVAMYADVTDIFARLLADAVVTDAESRAHALTSYLLGTAMQQAIVRISPEAIHAEIAQLCGLELAPRHPHAGSGNPRATS